MGIVPILEETKLKTMLKKIALAGCGLLLSATAQAAAYSAMYVFGDSLSDNGNITDPLNRTSFPYADGRFSNGPVAVEYLANRLGVPLYDYAVGGATTGLTNPFAWSLPDSGMMNQVQNFASAHPGGVDPNALYVVWGGPNDLLSSANPAAAVAGAVTNLVTEVGVLSALGARNILVPGLPALQLTPIMTGVTGADALSLAFNNALAAALPASVMRFDTYGLLESVVADPAAFGITNATDPCLNMMAGTLCANPSAYLFWDMLHPTTTVHAVLAERFAQVVPEPSALAWLGLVALGMMRRRVRG